ncbi:MAG: CDP-diacylglycerol--glycerol-3-phosphate 3-phosphatidyltransferase [Actinomycetota bacterium]|nr:CDP-diacylglycerol--glycerol-3-phosphate 3-phosphatidyltransferase [Actinomycetota bacterium]
MDERDGERSITERVKPLGLGWPNVVSALRMLVIPVIVVLILQRTTVAGWAALGVFVLGALSDGLDGYLARRHEMKTATGAWLDPLSDKLFVAVPAVVLAILSEFPWWAALVIVAREIAVQALRWRLDVRAVSMPASTVAKAKTATQLIAVGMSMSPLPDRLHTLTLAVTVLAVALTVYSGAEYFLTSRHRVEAR